MKNLLLFLYITCFIVGTEVYAQTDPFSDPTLEVLPPTPSAAAITKFVDFPVNYHTGTPQVDIPIYTLAGKKMAVPISLSYHAGGVRVNDIASNIGLGWSLQAGGVINRTVMGKADELPEGFFQRGSQVPDSPLSSSDETILNNFATETPSGWDGQPDMFSFSAGGYSGKFYFEDANTVRFIPHQDLKLTYTKCTGCSYPLGGALLTFTLTTPDGLQYTFGTEDALEYSETQNYSVNSGTACSVDDYEDPVVTAWYLKKIHNPNLGTAATDDIVFTYSAKEITYDLSYNESFRYPDLTPGNCPKGSSRTSCVTTKIDNGVFLESITSNFGKVVFVGNNNRSDMEVSNGKNKVTEIQILGKNDGLLKKYKLIQSFVSSSGLTPSTNSTSTYRMYLDKLELYDATDQFINQYSFEYLDRTALPSRLSYKQDHWGFYNSNGAAQLTPVQDNTLSTLSHIQSFFGNFNPADRSPDADKAKKGVLNKVIYPTGGYAEYAYEGNELGICSEVVSQEEETKYSFVTYTTGVETVTTPFTIDFDQTIAVSYFVRQIGFRCNGAYVTLLTAGGQDITPPFLKGGCANNGDARLFGNTGECPPGTNYSTCESGPAYIDLPAGNYVLIAKVFEGADTGNNNPEFSQNPEEASISVTYQKNVTEYVTNEPTGGIRVSQVKYSDNDSDASNDIIRKYVYTKDNAGCEASTAVRLGRMPKYYTAEVAIATNTAGCGYDECHYEKLSSSSLTNLVNNAGSIVGYTEVSELQGLSGENGKRSFKYQVFADLPSEPGPNNYDVFISAPTVDLTYKSGKLIEEKAYNANGNLVKEDFYDYEFSEDINENSTKAIFARKLFTLPCPNSTTALSQYAVEWYDLISQWVYLKSTTSRVYDMDESGNYVETITTYEYDTQNGNHTMPIATETENSDEKVTRTETNYAWEMITADPTHATVWTNMKDRNMVHIPLQTLTKVDNVTVSGQKTEYSFFNSSGLPTSSTGSNPPYPYKFYDYEVTWDAGGNLNDNGWDLRLTVEEYYNDSYPKKSKKFGWESENYSWSNGQLIQRTYEDFIWQYQYDNNSRLLTRSTDIDGQYIDYGYDDLMRLETITARNGNVVTTFDYEYKDAYNPQNFIHTKIDYATAANSGLDIIESFQYFDGLGRLIEMVKKQYTDEASPQDVVTILKYDNYGRLEREYEPFRKAQNTGAYVDVQGIYNNVNMAYPFTLHEYEDSPLNRVIGVTPPDWYETTMEYGTNTDEIKHPIGTDYEEGNLITTTVTDPNLNKTITFTDKLGRTLLSRRQKGTSKNDTYYIYDDKNRVTTVIPPGAFNETTGQVTIDLLYRYRYDFADNIEFKKIPDAAPMLMQYDNRDLLTASQDGNQAAASKWLVNIYDKYGRIEETGFYGSVPPEDTENLTLDSDDLLTETFYDGYDGSTTESNPVYKGKVRKTRTKILGVSENWMEQKFWYDSYGRTQFLRANVSTLVSNPTADQHTYSYDHADNLTQDSRELNMDGTGGKYYITGMKYDHQGRLKTTDFDMESSGFKRVSELVYSPKDEVQEKNIGRISDNGTPNNPSDDTWLQSLDYAYNPQGWLTMVNQPIKHPGEVGTFPVNADNDLFFLELNYDDNHTTLGTPAQKNGNISYMRWKTPGSTEKTYGFNYDYLDRLTTAKYGEQINSAFSATNNFETNYSYDARGNLMTLNRYALDNGLPKKIDNLQYTYYNPGSSNRIEKIEDTAPCPTYLEFSQPIAHNEMVYATNKISLKPGFSASGHEVDRFNASIVTNCPGNDKYTRGFNQRSSYTQNVATDFYQYDPNGNPIQDPNKKITITYNHLNLPEEVVSYEDGIEKHIEWLYDASGKKLWKIVSTGEEPVYQQRDIVSIKWYFDGVEYTDGQLEAAYHSEGRVTPKSGGDYQYEYNLIDHLGNVRVVFTEDGPDSGTAPDILQENAYYPFGMNIEELSHSSQLPENKYLYNGKELDDDFGLNWYHYGARMYDPVIGRFTGVDPISDQFPWVSTYNYAENEPIKHIDLHGLQKYDPQTGQTGPYTDEYLNSQSSSVNVRSANGGAPIAVYNSQLRINYSNEAAKLEPLYSEFEQTPEHIKGVNKRTELKEKTRTKMVGGRVHLDASDPIEPKFSSSQPGEPNPRFFKTNKGITNLAKFSRVGGVVGVGMTTYELADAASEGRFMEQAQVEGGKLAGAWAGMKITGGLIAMSPDPFTKHPVVAIVAVGVGGIVGSIAGEQSVKKLQAKFK